MFHAKPPFHLAVEAILLDGRPRTSLEVFTGLHNPAIQTRGSSLCPM